MAAETPVHWGNQFDNLRMTERSEAEITLVCEVEGLELPEGQEQTFMLPSDFTPGTLSAFVCSLLELETEEHFDFVGQMEGGEDFLLPREHVQVFMARHKLTTESAVTLAVRRPRGPARMEQLDSGRPWIVDIGSCSVQGELITVSLQSDATIKIYKEGSWTPILNYQAFDAVATSVAVFAVPDAIAMGQSFVEVVVGRLEGGVVFLGVNLDTCHVITAGRYQEKLERPLDQGVTRIRIKPDGTVVAVGTKAGYVRCFANERLLHSVTNGLMAATSKKRLADSPLDVEGPVLTTVNEGSPVVDLEFPVAEQMRSLCLAVYADGSISIADVVLLMEVGNWKLVKHGGVTCFCTSPCGRFLLTGNDNGRVRVFDVVMGQLAGLDAPTKLNLRSTYDAHSCILRVDWCPGSPSVFSATQGNSVVAVFDTRHALSPLQRCAVEQESQALALATVWVSPQEFVFGCSDGRLRRLIW